MSCRLDTCRKLATKAFHKTAHYDFASPTGSARRRATSRSTCCATTSRSWSSSTARTRISGPPTTPRSACAGTCSRSVPQLHGKKLGFNNLYDLHAARCLCGEFALPCAASSSSTTTPAASALAENLAAAYDKALGVRSRRRLRLRDRRQPARSTWPLAERMAELFVEVLFAPGYDDEALEILQRKPDIRILSTTSAGRPTPARWTTSACWAACSCRTGRRPRGPRAHGGREQAAPHRSRSGATSSSPAGSPSTSSRTPSSSPRTWPRSASAPAR